MTSISERLQAIRRDVEQAEQNAGRQPGSVRILAVSKTQGPECISMAVESGQHCFGENYVQEALGKISDLHDLPIEWHFIGPIQSNKTRPIAENFHWVHGVDRLKVAQRLSDARPPNLPALNVCIQVNVSGESSKSGCEPAEVQALARAVVGLPRLRLRGLMAIPEPTRDIALQHQRFRMLKELYQSLQDEGMDLDTLSMGMSGDYAAAIEEGATLVRIGTAIFGERKQGLQQNS